MRDRILVAYATDKGSTWGVAGAIAEQLAASGVAVDVRRVGDVGSLSPYRAVVIGSAIHGGKWLPEALDFVRANQSELRELPTACFFVCTMAATEMNKKKHVVSTYLEPVRQLIKPVAEGEFAGAVLYKDYSLLWRIAMWVFLKFVRLPEGDLRDWAAIRAWSDQTRPLLVGQTTVGES